MWYDHGETTALTEVDAVTMERNLFRAWVAERPEIADPIFTDVGSRVAKQLLGLAQRFGAREDGAIRLTHHVTQEELAHLSGAARETVNKVLTDFARRGWIRLDGRSMPIIDSESLLCRPPHNPGEHPPVAHDDEMRTDTTGREPIGR